jgi:hypothetical protein
MRQHICSCAWLALTALAIHLVLTFGHVHAEQFSLASPATASIVAPDAHAGGDADGGVSEERYRALRALHSCAVCASISLLGTSVVPVAQVIAPPQAITSIRKLDSVGLALPRELRSSSKARAPPPPER